MSSKPIYTYSDLINCHIGGRATLFITNRPGFSPDIPAFTSMVMSYDKATGVIETKNSTYIPEPE